MDYLDFELEIGPGSGRDYPVAVVRSPAGEARGTLRFPFDTLALENRLQALQIALLRSGGAGGPRRRVQPPQEASVEDFGRALFQALLADQVRARYIVSRDRAVEQGKGLRLKLRIGPPELAALPWEFLYDPDQAEYLCLSRRTPIVRYLELPRPIEHLTVTPPLRILGMVVSPTDLPTLDVEREQQRVQAAVTDLRARGLVDLTWLSGQTWRDLQRAMWAGPWHVFHFIGHGGFSRTTDEGVIALADEDGTTHQLSATLLGRLLDDHDPLRLVLLNACEGAQASTRDIFASTAATLVRRGIPAVLAMQYAISDRAAIEFAHTFYQAVAHGLTVDAAVAEARTAISIALDGTLEWGTPVLYTRSPDGVLFDLLARPAALTPMVEGPSLDQEQQPRQPMPGAREPSVPPPPPRHADLHLDLRPRHQAGRQAHFHVVLTNGGDQAVRVRLSLNDSGRGLRYAFGSGAQHPTQSSVVMEVMPGSEVEVPLQVQVPRLRLGGEARRYPFRVEAAVDGQLSADWSTEGEVVHEPVSPLIAGVPVLLLLSMLVVLAGRTLPFNATPAVSAPTVPVARVALTVAPSPVAPTLAPTLSATPIPASQPVTPTSSPQLITALPTLLAAGAPVVRDIAFAPDGQTLAAGLDDGRVRLWRVRDGQELRTLTGHAIAVYSLAFSRDGQVLASGLADSTVRLWRVSDGQELRTLTGHDAHVASVAFAPDRQTVASGSGDGTVRLWRVSDGQELRRLADNAGRVESIAFTPDGDLLAIGTQDGSVQLRRVTNGELLDRRTEHTEWVESVAFAPEGRTLASGSHDKTVRVWDVRDGTLRPVPLTFQGQVSTVKTVAFGPDGQTLAAGGGDGSVRVWRVSDGMLIGTLAGKGEILGVALAQLDGRTLLAAGGMDQSVQLWQFPE